MTDSDHSPQQTKGDSTRTNALEKEVARLRTLSQKQSVKYNKLKKTTSFQFLFFVLLLVMMFAYGIIQWPAKQDVSTRNLEEKPSAKDTTVTDTLVRPSIMAEPRPEIQKEDMLTFYVPEDGILFSIQIGAYTGVDMQPFQANMFSLQQYTYQTINQFTVGIFENFNDAESFRDIIQQMGFSDAFIIATFNGKRMPIKEALAIKSQQPALPEKVNAEPQPITIPVDSLP
ncbi:hypothetical protein [Geofilum rubicundum]|uniref:SPOR domain-containing protein n=1 Tax=Geofilum rubicundum JCM 15548 TaxID=1236989 RepID=A0A0E9LVH9_9BACT|nr:hypothetical protein [Geofilum rubicundum]GAO29259.1 hypothetical protein JCM15548_11427 [Geofilum rubicundum JCM 15548]